MVAFRVDSNQYGSSIEVDCDDRLDYFPAAVSCGSLNARAAVIGVRSPDHFQCCLEKTGSPGAPGSRDKMNPAFERKNAMVARLQAFSRLARSLDTKRVCLPVATIHTIR